MSQFIDFFLHIDRHLQQLIALFGSWSYVLLFLVIFCETGLVITPFLPGDSLLFAIGSFTALGSFSLPAILVVLCIAAIAGDSVNFWIGRKWGRALLKGKLARWIRKEHIEKTEAFYQKHGARMILLARFAPIIRTFAPFVAGLADMPYSVFMRYNIIGGLIWVNVFIFAGYFFGQISFIKNNFSFVAIAIVIVSLLPLLKELLSANRKSNT